MSIWKYAKIPGVDVNTVRKTEVCPCCENYIDVDVLHTGRVHDLKLSSLVKKVKPEMSKSRFSRISIKDAEGKLIGKGRFDPASFDKYTYGHNTLDIRRRDDKARFMDEPDEEGRQCVRVERCCEVKLVPTREADFSLVFDKDSTIVSENGVIDCSIKGMVGDDSINLWDEGIRHFYNKQEPAGLKKCYKTIDIDFYDSNLQNQYPVEIDDPPLIHGQLRLLHRKELGNKVYVHSLLLVESHVMWSKDPRAVGLSTDDRYFMDYYVESKIGKRYKKQREYYDRATQYWMKNKWFQRGAFEDIVLHEDLKQKAFPK